MTRFLDVPATNFDSVGFALEDYSALRYLYSRAMQHGVGDDISLIPPAADPKNLFALIAEHVPAPCVESVTEALEQSV